MLTLINSQVFTEHDERAGVPRCDFVCSIHLRGVGEVCGSLPPYDGHVEVDECAQVRVIGGRYVVVFRGEDVVRHGARV